MHYYCRKVSTISNSVTVAEIMKLIKDAPNKQSWLDPLPMWLLKSCSDVLSPFLCTLCYTSLRTGVVPALFKTAIVTPLIKKPHMDPNTLHITGRSQIYPSFPSSLNVLSAPSFNHMSISILCFHPTNQRTGAVILLKQHWQKFKNH